MPLYSGLDLNGFNGSAMRPDCAIAFVLPAASGSRYSDPGAGSRVCGNGSHRAMIGRGIFNQRLVAVFFLGWLLLGFPMLAAFDRPVFVFGIPLLYAYVLCAWALLIVLLALIVERRR